MKDAIMLGTGYGMFSLEKKKNTKTNTPTLEHVSFFNMFYEPLAKDFYDSRYKVRRRIISTDQLYRSYNWFTRWSKTIDEFKELQ